MVFEVIQIDGVSPPPGQPNTAHENGQWLGHHRRFECGAGQLLCWRLQYGATLVHDVKPEIQLQHQRAGRAHPQMAGNVDVEP